MHNTNCPRCGKSLEDKRASAKYCSNSCRVAACQERKGIKPFFDKSTNKTQPNKRRAHIANIIDRQDLKLQELQAKRNALIWDYQSTLNKLPEYRGKLIGFGTGLYLSRNEEPLVQLASIVGLTLVGALVDNTLQQTEQTKIQKLNFIAYRIKAIDSEILAIEVSTKQNRVVMSAEPKTEPIKAENENLPVIELPQLVTTSNRKSFVDVGRMTLADLNKQTFDTINLGNEYEFIGEPESNFYMVLHGQPGNGKSTWALNFAHYLSNNFGKVLYNSSEEGFSKSLQNKAKDMKSDYLYLSNLRTFDDLRKEIAKGYYRFIFIDSINDMKITPEELQLLRSKNKKSGFIGVLQATKGGNFKGSNDFAHDCDIKIRFENYVPIMEKNRYK